MGKTKMPEWMMDYAASIEDENFNVFREYCNLSDRYYNEINNYNQNIYPNQNLTFRSVNKARGIDKGDFDKSKELNSIDQKYKEEALDIACKYGYERPPKSVSEYSDSLTKLQENSKYASVLKENTRGVELLTHDDVAAKEAHKKYFEKHPQSKQNLEKRKSELRWMEEAGQADDMFSVPYPEQKEKKSNFEELQDHFDEKYRLKTEFKRTHRLDHDDKDKTK